jgi:hypothetical protein
MKSGPAAAAMSMIGARRLRVITALFAIVPVLCVFGADLSCACFRTPSLTTVDEALSKAELSGEDKVKATGLRAELADLISQGNDRAARALEEQIMNIAGLKLIPTRGCARWEPKAK